MLLYFTRYNQYVKYSDNNELKLNDFLAILHDNMISNKLREYIDTVNVDIPSDVLM